MKQLSRISIFFFLLLAIGCSSQTATPTSLPVTAAIENTETPKPTSTTTTSPSPTPEQITIEFPEWVKNPETQILLVPVGTHDKGYENMALFNAETGERFDIPFTTEPRDYFWMPNGSQIGLLENSKKQIMIISIKDGSVDFNSLSNNAFRFIGHNNSYNPVQISSSDIFDPDLLFIPSGYELSFNERYFVYQEKYNNTYTSVFDTKSNQVIDISDADDEYFDLFSAWSPNSNFLAISQATENPGNYYTFTVLPTIRLRVYDVQSQKVIASYKNVTFPKWSPDGTKFLFQEWKDLNDFVWYAVSPPCVFDTVSGITDCYNETYLYFKEQNPASRILFSSVKWSPDQTMIGYIYSEIDHGFCTTILTSEQTQCNLSNFDYEGQKIIRYDWSSNSKFISLEYDTSCPYCDYRDFPKIAIANVETGNYFQLGDSIYSPYLGLWRPLINP